MPKKEESEIRKKINKVYEENEYANLQQNRNRARSVTVGTAFGGTIEINMRGDYHSLWCLLNPVEALELAEQLAAASGVQIAMRPKDDFSAWRGWDVDNVKHIHWKGVAPWQINQEDKELEASKEPKKLPPGKEESSTETEEETPRQLKRSLRKRVKE